VRAERAAQVDRHRVGRDHLFVARVLEGAEPPRGEPEHDGLELAPVRGQLVDDDARARCPTDDARRLQLLEPRAEDGARAARRPRTARSREPPPRQACSAAVSTSAFAASGSIHPNSSTWPSGSVSCRWYMKP